MASQAQSTSSKTKTKSKRLKDYNDSLNYRSSRDAYMKELSYVYKNNYQSVVSGESREIASEETVKKLIDIIKGHGTRTVLANESLATVANLYRVELQTSPDADILVRSKSTTDPKEAVEVLGYENAFEILYDTHRRYGHCNGEQLEKHLRNKYEIPSKCYEIFTRICYVCRHNYSSFNKNVQAQIIKFPVPEENFSLVLLYKDTWTDYHLLRPLSSDSQEEIAIELLKIFTDFGIPKVMCVTDFQWSLLKESLKKLEKFLPCALLIQAMTDEENESNTNKIVEMMKNWMDTSSSSDWAYGCYETQMRLNKTSKFNELKDSPYVRVFGELNLQEEANDSKTNPISEENVISTGNIIYD